MKTRVLEIDLKFKSLLDVTDSFFCFVAILVLALKEVEFSKGLFAVHL